VAACQGNRCKITSDKRVTGCDEERADDAIGIRVPVVGPTKVEVQRSQAILRLIADGAELATDINVGCGDAQGENGGVNGIGIKGGGQRRAC